MQYVAHHPRVLVPAQAQTPVLPGVVAVAGLMALGAAARLELPFSPVPITLQTFMALIAAYLVGPRQAVAGIALYLGLAMAGAPLLAAQGIATAGYLAAMLLCPLIVTQFRSPTTGMLAATAFIYLLGASWLVWVIGLTPGGAVLAGIVPFLPGDAIKVMFGVALVRRIQPT